VVEKGRSVWVGGDPRGPSAAPQDDTPSEEGGEVEVEVEGEGEGNGNGNGKKKQQQQQRQRQRQRQMQMRGFFTAFRMTTFDLCLS
jgi:hypothetical protein